MTKKINIFSIITILILFAVTEPGMNWLHKGIFNTYEAQLLEPLFFCLLSLFISTLILLFFNERISQIWWSRVMIWFVPVSFVIIASGTVGSSYAWFPRTFLAMFMGSVLVGATLIFALVHKFYFKTQ